MALERLFIWQALAATTPPLSPARRGDVTPIADRGFAGGKEEVPEPAPIQHDVTPPVHAGAFASLFPVAFGEERLAASEKHVAATTNLAAPAASVAPIPGSGSSLLASAAAASEAEHQERHCENMHVSIIYVAHNEFHFLSPPNSV
jgi:hypothetical protein